MAKVVVSGRDAEREAALARQYVPLVHHVVSGVASRLPRHVPVDDLVSAGMLGLAEAVRSFDPSRGVPFSSYASNRIRGALLDELRSLDWASRSVRARSRVYDEGVTVLTAELGRVPTQHEVAVRLGVAPADVQQIVDDVHRAKVVHYDAVVPGDDGEALLTSTTTAPEDALLERERIGYLRDAVGALPERMRVVVHASYFEERLLQDIADELGVTESRVSQIRTRALALLKDGMNAPLDPERVADRRRRPVERTARAAYVDAIAAASDVSGRLEHQPLQTVAG